MSLSSNTLKKSKVQQHEVIAKNKTRLKSGS